jgi:glycogen operon protein
MIDLAALVELVNLDVREETMAHYVSSGRPFPLGATVTHEGTNFSVFSRHGTAVYLELFQAPDDQKPFLSLRFDPSRNRTGDVWHMFVKNLCHGQLYGFRVDGPYTPEETGDRFNVNKLLLDPYAQAVAGAYNFHHDDIFGFDRNAPDQDLSFNSADSTPHTVKSVAVVHPPYDWENARSIRRPLQDSVFYEVHVKGLSAGTGNRATHPGTYLGVVESIPHLLKLGVTCVELLPVHHFNRREINRHDPLTGAPLVNYWGYSTLGFFAPEPSYRCGHESTSELIQFKEMVKRLHLAGIEVILDVVFNHTGEGNHLGPTVCFRGLDNSIYYMLERKRLYRNYSGCGNTVQCNHPVLKQLILDCLRHWVIEMHVDGFRFDLATILGRDRKGAWIGDLSLLYDIAGDPVLRGCKLIAEAWDAEGMYKVGSFPEGWAEWNGRFRDDVRRFVRGDHGMVADLARRIGGSHDLFGNKTTPSTSINFTTAHDGFSIRDLCSYATKQNERNGEGNRDGSDHDYGSNGGVEGETDDSNIRRQRLQQAKNMLTILFLARGTPMLRAGDELWQTKQGNNNTYCQDNALSWLDWRPTSESVEMFEFVRKLIDFRQRHAVLRRPSFVDPFAVAGAGEIGAIGNDVSWHGVRPDKPDWSYHSHSLAFHIRQSTERANAGDLFAMLNAWTEPLKFALPTVPPGYGWRRIIDTHCPAPDDFLSDAQGSEVDGSPYRTWPRSSVVLLLSEQHPR